MSLGIQDLSISGDLRVELNSTGGAVDESVNLGGKFIDINMSAGEKFNVVGDSVVLSAGGLQMSADIEITEITSANESYLSVAAKSLSVGFGGTEVDPIIGISADEVNMQFFSDGIVASAKEIVPVLNMSGVNLFSAGNSTNEAKLDLQINTRTTDYYHE